MYQISNECKKAINHFSRELYSKAYIDNNEIYAGDIISYEINEGVISGDDFELGGAVASFLELKINNLHGYYDNIELNGKEIKLFTGILLENSTIEYVPMGVFTIDEVVKDKNMITIEATDKMVILEDYYESKLNFPTTVLEIAKEICSLAGITLSEKQFYNSDFIVNSLPSEITLRDVIHDIAEIAGGFVKINRIGELEIITPGIVAACEINKDKCIELKIKEGFYVDNLTIVENYFPVPPVPINLNVLPFSSKWQGDFSIDSGDRIMLSDGKNTYETIITKQKISFNGGLRYESECVGLSDQQKSTQRISNTEKTNKRHRSEIKQLADEIALKVSNGEMDAALKLLAENLTVEFTEIHNEGYEQGITKITKDGIEVSHSDVSCKSKLKAQGHFIEDENGETIAYLTSKEQWTELKADKVFADNVENVYLGDSNLYVNHAYTGESDGTIEKPFKSFSELSEHFGTGKIINKTVNINIVSAGDIYDCFQMFGFSGRGNFNITFNKTSILRWAGNHTIDFRDIDITCRLYFGNTGNSKNDGAIIDNRTTQQGSYTHCMYFNNCKKIIIADGVRVRSAQWASDNNSGICSDNSYIYVNYIDTCDSGCGFYVANGGKIVVINSRGNCTIKPAYILNGGALYQGMPGQTCLVQMGNSVVQNGHNYTFGTLTGSNSLLTSPPSPPTQDTRYLEFNTTDYGYWNELYNSWNSNGKTIYQGSWGYGNCRGVFIFNNTSINSYLSSATVLDGSTITLQRESAGGYSSAQTIYLYGTTHTSASGSAPPVTKSYGAIGSLAWGEKKTFSLPKAFVQDLKAGTIKSIMFYTSSGSNYIKFSPLCTLRLKISK